jgi:hypothetical protein
VLANPRFDVSINEGWSYKCIRKTDNRFFHPCKEYIAHRLMLQRSLIVISRGVADLSSLRCIMIDPKIVRAVVK